MERNGLILLLLPGLDAASFFSFAYASGKGRKGGKSSRKRERDEGEKPFINWKLANCLQAAAAVWVKRRFWYLLPTRKIDAKAFLTSVYIFLSNRTYPTMDNNKLGRDNYRSEIQTIIYDALIPAEGV